MISSAFDAGTTALVEAEEDITDKDSTTVMNWLRVHSVELVPGNYQEPETMENLAQLMLKAYCKGYHINIHPVSRGLSAFSQQAIV